MIVMKFGGTSTQDAAAIRNVVHIVARHADRQPVVTISAIAQATNVLENAGKEAAEGRSPRALELLRGLATRHEAMTDELIRDQVRNRRLKEAIAAALADLEELVKGVAILRELTPRTLDAFYSYGELLSSRLVAAALSEAGVESVWLDTADFMVTDENFNRAMPVMEIVREKLTGLVAPLLALRKIPVTQGFIGITPTGRRTTMGRESSDFSAAIIGAALDASDIQIWTDVDGVLTADPREVPSAMKIKSLSFEEAYQLSYFGAKVLHPNTMLPAIERNIPIHILNSRSPGKSGTVVTALPTAPEPVVKSVASRRNLTMINVAPQKRYGQYLMWEHILGVLTKYGAAAGMTVTSEYNYSMVLESRENIEAIRRELEEAGRVEVLSGCGLVCIVGSNIRSAPRIVDRVFRALSDTGISMISFGASRSNLSLVIPDAAVPGAVRSIHREFFEAGGHPAVFEVLDEAAAAV